MTPPALIPGPWIQSATHSWTFPTMSLTPHLETQVGEDPVTIGPGVFVLQVVTPSPARPGSGVPAAAYNFATPTYGNDSISGINEGFHLEAPQTGGVGDDYAIDGLPAAIARGGIWTSGEGGGIFTLAAEHAPSSLDNATGFRCAR